MHASQGVTQVLHIASLALNLESAILEVEVGSEASKCLPNLRFDALVHETGSSLCILIRQNIE